MTVSHGPETSCERCPHAESGTFVPQRPVQWSARPHRLIAVEDVQDYWGGIVPDNATAIGEGGRRYETGECVR